MDDTYHAGNNAEIEVFENEGILRKVYREKSFARNNRKGVLETIQKTAELQKENIFLQELIDIHKNDDSLYIDFSILLFGKKQSFICRKISMDLFYC